MIAVNHSQKRRMNVKCPADEIPITVAIKAVGVLQKLEANSKLQNFELQTKPRVGSIDRSVRSISII